MFVSTSRATCAMALLLTATGPASAFNLLTNGGLCPNGAVFASDPDYAVNISTAPDGIGQYLIGAFAIVSERVSQVGGQSFDIVNMDVVFDTLAVGDNDGENDIGLADLSASGAGAMGPSIVDTSTCTIEEANILINEASAWAYFDPGDHGDDYFNANSVSNGLRYLQPVLLHELGHNYSLAHSTDSYTFMNSGTSTTTGRPWSNRRDDKRIEPLPDMRRALRDLYGNGTDETDVAALNTWFDDSTGASPAPQRLLCKPSSGVDFSPSIFDEFCGITSTGADGSDDVCIGENIYTRVALPNYGTDDMTVDVELWFSQNDWLNRDAGADVASPTVKTGITLSAGTSARKGFKFEVPDDLVPGTEYYPIIFVNSGTELSNEESDRNNWIPLRHKITARDEPFVDCVLSGLPTLP